MPQWMDQLGGKFVVFDGPDGSGKSTQLARFADAARAAGVTVCAVREPGGTSIGEQIRKVLLDPANADMALRCEMMLYMASRAQLIDQTIGPALERGELVLADRFISSTFAYQGAAGGLSAEEIRAVGQVALAAHWPEVTVILDVDPKTGARRLNGPASKGAGPTLFSDRMELKEAEYHRLVRQGFLDQAAADPDHYIVIDGSEDADRVFQAILAALAARFES